MGILSRVASVAGSRVTVDTSADRLDVAPSGKARMSVLVQNRGAVAVYLGGSGVTSAAGFQLDPGDSVSIDLSGQSSGLYGITASGSAVVHVLQSEVT